jgi:hypothetical protein
VRGVRRTIGAAIRDESGQMMPLLALGALVVMIGFAAFAIDVGHGYFVKRQLQASADAAALAGAQLLPDSGAATTLAQEYGPAGNNQPRDAQDVQTDITTECLPSAACDPVNAVVVTETAQMPTTFAKVFGIDSLPIHSKAVARAVPLVAAYQAAPFGVVDTQPELAGPDCPCFGGSTTLTIGKTGPGGFDIIDIDGSHGGASPGTVGEWIENGCSCETSTPVWLYGDPGAKFDASQVQDAMTAMIGHTILFPVYDDTRGSGAGLQYHVIGFAGFTLSGFDLRGSDGTISGSFVSVSWKGTGSDSATYFGATTPQLVG